MSIPFGSNFFHLAKVLATTNSEPGYALNVKQQQNQLLNAVTHSFDDFRHNIKSLNPKTAFLSMIKLNQTRNIACETLS